MKVRASVGAGVILLAVALAWVRAEEPAASEARPATEAMPAAEKTPAAEKPRPAKLVQPWSRLTSLTEEQKLKIREIHGAAVAEINAIRQKEQANILALLTDEQKAQLKTLQEETAAQRKQRAAERKQEAAPAPAAGE